MLSALPQDIPPSFVAPAAPVRPPRAVRPARVASPATAPSWRDHPVTCVCLGSGWVCEDHPWIPYAAERPAACSCDAPGQPCPGIQDAPCEDCGETVKAAVIVRTGRRAHDDHQPDPPPQPAPAAARPDLSLDPAPAPVRISPRDRRTVGGGTVPHRPVAHPPAQGPRRLRPAAGAACAGRQVAESPAATSPTAAATPAQSRPNALVPEVTAVSTTRTTGMIRSTRGSSRPRTRTRLRVALGLGGSAARAQQAARDQILDWAANAGTQRDAELARRLATAQAAAGAADAKAGQLLAAAGLLLAGGGILTSGAAPHGLAAGVAGTAGVLLAGAVLALMATLDVRGGPAQEWLLPGGRAVEDQLACVAVIVTSKHRLLGLAARLIGLAVLTAVAAAVVAVIA